VSGHRQTGEDKKNKTKLIRGRVRSIGTPANRLGFPQPAAGVPRYDVSALISRTSINIPRLVACAEL